jgi:hypothetical protein
MLFRWKTSSAVALAALAFSAGAAAQITSRIDLNPQRYAIDFNSQHYANENGLRWRFSLSDSPAPRTAISFRIHHFTVSFSPRRTHLLFEAPAGFNHYLQLRIGFHLEVHPLDCGVPGAARYGIGGFGMSGFGGMGVYGPSGRFGFNLRSPEMK